MPLVIYYRSSNIVYDGPPNNLGEKMEVNDFQKKIVDFASKWDKKRNNIPDAESTLIHLMEEVGELSRQYINKRMRKEKFDEEEVENAIGDALMQLVKIAHLEGLNIENVVTEIIEDEQKRFLE